MKHHIGKIAASLATALIVAAPFAAGAVSVSELQAQVQVLMQRIMQLQGNGSSSSDPAIGASTSLTAIPQSHRICSLLNRNLGVGARGDDVAALQDFLYSEKVLTVSSTGYFGPMTAQAVAQWQSREGVTSVGAFGPMSRERMKIRCGGGMPNQERFSASPTSGSAPLTVSFNTWLSGFRINTISYVIDYGDGSQENAASCPAPADACTGPGVNTHTYTANGSYTALLKKITNTCPPGAQCFAAPTVEVVAKQQVTVGAQNSGNLSADPSSGAAPLSVGFTFQPGGENGQYLIEYGDGASEQMSFQQIYCIRAPCISPYIAKHTYTNTGTYTATVSPYIACLYSNPPCMVMQPAPLASVQVSVTGTSGNPADDNQCKVWNDGCNTCSRTSPGGMAACTLMYCANPGPAYCKERFDSTANKPPTISGLSGPTTLSVNQNGTWTINASDPEGGQLTYQIWWGDENVYAPSMSSAGAARDFVQATTFTHAYANAGTYTVNMTVRDSAGQEAKTSSTVQVGSDAVICTMEYAPVCGRPSGCMNTCAQGMACPAICQLPTPQTYGNRCSLNGAGATFLHTGECTATSGNWY